MNIELFVLLPLLPLLGLLPLGLLRQRPAAMAWSVLGVALSSAALAVVLLPALLAQGRAALRVTALVGELSFALDATSLMLVLVTTVVWSAASLYTIGYLQGGHLLRYHLTSLITLSAMLGILIAGDLITLYLFFEWLGLSATLFVLHSGSTRAIRAATKYLVLTLLGGLAVLSGALLVQGLGGGSLDAAVVFTADQAGLASAAALLLLAGFGVKAGLIALHIWLPDAHTAAPAPASALLSGLMIKAGAYGIVRSVGVLFAGDGGRLLLGGGLVEGVIVVGVLTMVLGVVMALLQVEAKRLLAYSSVSQMGFILVGIGSAAYLAEAGAIGWIGALLHIVSHALGKALLFLAVGALVAATGSGDMRDWGGLARRRPLTMVLFAIGALSIAGLPGFAGFASKSILHHALEYAEALHGAVGLALAERLFTLSSIGTAAALWKLFGLAFLGVARSREGAPAAAGTGATPWSMHAGMVMLALSVVALGLRPALLATLLEGVATSFGVRVVSVLSLVSSPLATPSDVWAALLALLLGAPVALWVARSKLTPAALPLLFSLDRLVLLGLGGGQRMLRAWEAEWRSVDNEARRLLAHERAWRKRSEAQGLRRAQHLAWQLLRFESLVRSLERRLHRTAQPAEPPRKPEALLELEAVALEEALLRERGAAEERFAVRARARIARLSRDLNLNLSLLFLLWFSFLLLLVLAG